MGAAAGARLPANRGRRARFFALEKVVLPVAIHPLKMLVRSWRPRGAEHPDVAAALAAPRLLVATWHGMFLHLLAYAPLVQSRGRRLVVLVSPSLDGRLLAAALAHFGIEHVFGSSNARGVSGAREFIARIGSGDVGIIAADGPRGPCCVAKPGLLEIAALADAQVFLASTAARRGITLPAWDRSHLPPPFAALELAARPFVPAAEASLDLQLAAMQSQLLALTRSMASPVLPPAHRG
jgi:lysophospholipid acyltransferase (LPLAT)-like uncharacterized protein